MKSIKKISLVALATILSISFASAQVGIQAGYTSNKSSVENSKAMNGFHVGPIYNMSIQGPVSLQYGLLYNYVTASSTVLGITGKSTNHSIDIPVRVAASFPFASGFSSFVFAIPAFNIGLANPITNSLTNDKLDLYKDFDMQRFDLMLGAGAGLQYNNIGLKFSYDFGMLNRYKDADPAQTVNSMKVGLFYNF